MPTGGHAQRKRTQCPQGHPYSEENTYRYGKSRYCKQCSRASSKRRRNSPQGKRYIAQYLKRRRAERKQQAITLLGGLCKDCGKAFPGRPEVFDFDHLRNKTTNISWLMQATWERVLQELDKCELVCSNCHRTRTKQRGGASHE